MLYFLDRMYNTINQIRWTNEELRNLLLKKLVAEEVSCQLTWAGSNNHLLALSRYLLYIFYVLESEINGNWGKKRNVFFFPLYLIGHFCNKWVARRVFFLSWYLLWHVTFTARSVLARLLQCLWKLWCHRFCDKFCI